MSLKSHFSKILLSLFSILLLSVAIVQATPTQFGDTGLISQPTAETLNEGNICIGLWTNCSDGVDNGTGDASNSMIVPATITMGLGTFIETYGSYPNLLFNGDEDDSGRGFANAGFKFRVYGARSDAFRLGLDIGARRSVSDEADYDGLTDYVSRFIASYKAGIFGVHVNAGYAFNDSPGGDVDIDYDDQVLFGAGVEFFPANRLRILSEFSYETEKIDGLDGPSEVTVGFQYFLTPHLTVNVGAGIGLSDASPDWRALFGFSTCQGVGTFNRPVPTLVEPEPEVVEVVAPTKIVKVRMLTPLVTQQPKPVSPVSHLEVPVSGPEQEQIVDPADRMQSPQIAKLEASAIGPIRSVSDAGSRELPDKPFAAKVVRLFRFPEFAFSFNQWDLSPEGEKSFSMVAEELRREDRFFIISIEGHTDDIGPDGYNMNLSFRRAVSAATHLVLRNGISPAQIFVKAFGESRPIATNETKEGRSQNRRVELKVLIPEGYEDVKPESALSPPGADRKLQDSPAPPQRESTDSGQDSSVEKSQDASDAVSHLKQPEPVDALSIEQAIIDKTAPDPITPTGAITQLDSGVKAE